MSKNKTNTAPIDILQKIIKNKKLDDALIVKCTIGQLRELTGNKPNVLQTLISNCIKPDKSGELIEKNKEKLMEDKHQNPPAPEETITPPAAEETLTPDAPVEQVAAENESAAASDCNCGENEACTDCADQEKEPLPTT